MLVVHLMLYLPLRVNVSLCFHLNLEEGTFSGRVSEPTEGFRCVSDPQAVLVHAAGICSMNTFHAKDSSATEASEWLQLVDSHFTFVAL